MTNGPSRTHGDAESNPLDAHLDALGAGLADAVWRGDRRRRRTILGTGAGVVALAAALGALVIIPGAPRTLDPVAEARAALGEAGDGILHYVVDTEMRGIENAPGEFQNRSIPAMEVWTATSGDDRWRLRYPADGRPLDCDVEQFGTVHGRGIGPELVRPIERARDATISTVYSPFSRAAVTVPLHPISRDAGAHALTNTPSFGPSDPRDPVAMVRDALGNGLLRVGGPTVIDGRRVLRLVGRVDEMAETQRRREREAAARGETLTDDKVGDSAAQRAFRRDSRDRPTRLTYFVDATSFAPVELQVRRYQREPLLGTKQRWVITETRDHYTVYERLADTPEHRALLAIDPPAGSTVARESEVPANVGGKPSEQAVDQAAVRRCEAVRRPR